MRGDRDASTLWYAVMRKQTRGVFIGTLCIRHSDHHASLLEGGWEEVAPEDIDVPARPLAVPVEEIAAVTGRRDTRTYGVIDHNAGGAPAARVGTTVGCPWTR